MFRSLSKRFSFGVKAVESPTDDARELIGTILPCCLHRHTIRNDIVRMIRDLHETMEAQGEAPRHKHLLDIVVPATSPSTGMAELHKDLNLLDHVIAMSQSTNNKSKLMALKHKIQAQIDVLNEKQREKALNTVKQRDEDHQWLAYVVEQVSDRPHIYNKVVMQLQQLHHEVSFHQRRRGGRNHNNSNNKNKTVAPLRWQQEVRPKAQDRWEDVMRLDELIDIVPKSSSINKVLISLKDQCRDEAKKLQKTEITVSGPVTW